MSIQLNHDLGFYVCHETFLNNSLYDCERPTVCKKELFHIYTTYSSIKNEKKRKSKMNCNCSEEFIELEKDVKHVKTMYERFYKTVISNSDYLIQKQCEKGKTNKDALELAEQVYRETEKNCVKNAFGSNFNPPSIKEVGTLKYVFPENCRFYCSDILDIGNHLRDESFDFILLDPPWWNKYIRRKRKKSNHAYDMMYNNQLKNIPIDVLLKENGIVAVWCTNSRQHFEYLISDIFPSWRVKYICKWFWVKVTKSGEPVCNFSIPPGKQPFEKIVFACRKENELQIPDGKLIVSVPSAIHSHKPPLTEVLASIIPKDAKCLEIFARYLLPNWTSFGNEVLKLQHESLFDILDESK